jgi:signal transduction histidine kinase
VPAAVGTTFYEEYTRAMESQEPVTFEEWFEPLDTWFDVRAFPSESGLSVYFRDVTTEKRLRHERQESLRAFQRLYRTASDGALSFEEKLGEMLTAGCEYLSLPNGFLTRIEDGTVHMDVAVGPHPDLESGGSCSLKDAYCKRTIDRDDVGDGPLAIADAAEAGWSGDPAFERFRFRSYVGGRVERDGSLYGTVCFADSDPKEGSFSDTERAFVELLTRWAGYELERQAVESRLRRERDRLDEFAAVISHDLRNPLNTAMGYANLLEADAKASDGRLDEGITEQIDALRTALDRMDALTEEVLTLARNGSVVEGSTPVALTDVARNAWATTDTDDASLRITDEATGTDVLADAGRLQQLFENVFRNAAEHAGPAPTVTVGTLTDRAGFWVADDGPGIPPADRDRVFEAGYTTEKAGTGFGLGIVERVAEAHGWTVSVAGDDSDGARFEVWGVEFA